MKCIIIPVTLRAAGIVRKVLKILEAAPGKRSKYSPQQTAILEYHT